MPPILDSILIDWVLIASVFAFLAMGADKLLALCRVRRISERSLWLTALLGGFLGIFVGGFVFHHKTSKAEFWAPVAIASVLWTAAILAITSHFSGRLLL